MKSLLLLILMMGLISYSQSPGNVSGNSLWLEPESFNNVAFEQIKDIGKIKVLYFNFNPVLDPLNTKKSTFNNLVAESYSLFTVFKSDTDDKLPIITILKGNHKVSVDNKAVVSNFETPYEKSGARKGMLLNFLTSNNSKGRKKNYIKIEDFYKGDKDGTQQLMEVIYYPRILKPIERQRIETYLSLKYGISRIGEADYLNSGNDTIWNYKKNMDFNSRVTGIGRDDKLSLYQKQSGNAEKDGLYIGLGIIDTTNTHNQGHFEDKNFIIWGDNGKSTIFKKDKDDRAIKVISRIWKIQLTAISPRDSVITQLRISKKEMGFEPSQKDEVFWIALNGQANTKFDYTSARYIKQSLEDDEYVYFNNVIWDTDADGVDTFTFVKGPDYFIEYDIVADCGISAPGTINVKINGGTAPYTIKINNISPVVTEEDTYTLTGLAEGSLSLIVTDSKGNVQTGSPMVEYLTGSGISLESVWHLDKTGHVVVSPKVSQNSGLIYKWSKTGGNTFDGPIFTAYEVGEYTLTVINDNDCKKTIPFTVKPAAPAWSVYPNPSKSGEAFYIAFDLEKESVVAVRISSLEGKSFLEEKIGKIQRHTYSGSILTSGVYLVTVTINGIDETVKLIVK